MFGPDDLHVPSRFGGPLFPQVQDCYNHASVDHWHDDKKSWGRSTSRRTGGKAANANMDVIANFFIIFLKYIFILGLSAEQGEHD